MTNTENAPRVNRWIAQAEAKGLTVTQNEYCVEISNPADGHYAGKIWIFQSGGTVSAVRYYPGTGNQVKIKQQEVAFYINLDARSI